MAGTSFYRRTNRIRNNISELFHVNKKTCLILLAVVIFGALVGILSVCNNATRITIINISDKTLIDFFCNRISLGSVFFNRLINLCFCFLVILIANSNKFLFPLNFILIAYRSFFVFFNITVIIIVCGVGGLLFSLIVLFPIALLSLLILSILICVCMNRSRCSCSGSAFSYDYKMISILLLLAIALLIIETLLISIFSPIFIIII